MAATSPPKKSTRSRAAATLAAAPPTTTYKFAQLKKDAGKGVPEVAPFIIDDVEPPIVITGPDTERAIVIVEKTDDNGNVQVRDIRVVLEAMCGDAMPQVWDLIRGESFQVMLELFKAISRHFEEPIKQAADDMRAAADAPGGSEPS